MSQPKVLIVEDEKDLREILSDMLSSEFECFVAEHGLDALKIVKENTIDCIVSDISMPEMDGIELLKRLRDDGNIIPFIIVTAFGDKNHIMNALKLGAIDFLEKPYNYQHILEVVQHAASLGKVYNNSDDGSNQSLEINKMKLLINKMKKSKAS